MITMIAGKRFLHVAVVTVLLLAPSIQTAAAYVNIELTDVYGENAYATIVVTTDVSSPWTDYGFPYAIVKVNGSAIDSPKQIVNGKATFSWATPAAGVYQVTAEVYTAGFCCHGWYCELCGSLAARNTTNVTIPNYRVYGAIYSLTVSEPAYVGREVTISATGEWQCSGDLSSCVWITYNSLNSLYPVNLSIYIGNQSLGSYLIYGTDPQTFTVKWTPPSPGVYTVKAEMKPVGDVKTYQFTVYDVKVDILKVTLPSSTYFIPNNETCYYTTSGGNKTYYCWPKDPVGYTASYTRGKTTPLPINSPQVQTLKVAEYAKSINAGHIYYTPCGYDRALSISVSSNNTVLETQDTIITSANSTLTLTINVSGAKKMRNGKLEVKDSTGNVVYSKAAATPGTYTLNVPAGKDYYVSYTIPAKSGSKYCLGGSVGAWVYKPDTITKMFKKVTSASGFSWIEVPGTTEVCTWPSLSGRCYDWDRTNRIKITLSEYSTATYKVDYCPVKSYTKKQLTANNYQQITCCLATPDHGKSRLPVYLEAGNVFGLNESLPVKEGKVEVNGTIKFLVMEDTGSTVSGFLSTLTAYASLRDPPGLYFIGATPATNKIPLMQLDLPAKVSALFGGLVNEGGSTYGVPGGILPYCPPTIAKVDGAEYRIPPECTSISVDKGGATFKVSFVDPVENRPGASKTVNKIVTFGSPSGFSVNQTISLSTSRSYAFMNESGVTFVVEFVSSAPVTSAKLKNGSQVMTGIITDPYRRVEFRWFGKPWNETWTLEICVGDFCKQSNLQILGEPYRDLNVTYICSMAPPPPPGSPAVEILYPSDGAVLSPGTHTFQVRAYVAGGMGSITEVEMFVSKGSKNQNVGYCSRTSPVSGDTYSCEFTLNEENNYKLTVYAEASSGKRCKTKRDDNFSSR